MDCAVILPVARLYNPTMTVAEAYEATRGYWTIGEEKRGCLQFAVAAYRGHVQEVYRIKRWVPAPPEHRGKWAFIGIVAEQEVRDRYVGQSLENYRNQLAFGSRVYTPC